MGDVGSSAMLDLQLFVMTNGGDLPDPEELARTLQSAIDLVMGGDDQGTRVVVHTDGDYYVEGDEPDDEDEPEVAISEMDDARLEKELAFARSFDIEGPEADKWLADLEAEYDCRHANH